MSHFVCLSFDFDTIALWMATGQTSPTPISRGEFGVVGAERLLRLTERAGIRTTWFIPGITIDAYPDACRAVADAGHEIGHHGYRHVTPRSLDRDGEAAELARGIEAIERIAGRAPRGYRSPAWDLSEHSVDLLLEHGFLYDSSMMGHDSMPYAARRGDHFEDDAVHFGKPSELVELPISWSLDDYPHFEFHRSGGLMHAPSVFENWLGDFLYMRDELDWGVLTYTCHPFVIGRGHRIRELERFIARLQAEGAEFVTCEFAAGAYRDMIGAKSPP